MRSPIINIIILLLTITIWSCKSKEKVVEQRLDLKQLNALDMHVTDSLYIPWQMFSADSQPPAIVARHTNIKADSRAETSATTTQTKKKISSKQKGFSLEQRHIYFYWFAIIILLLIVVRLTTRR